MKKKIIFILLIIIANTCLASSWTYEKICIGNLYYNFDTENKIAEVTYTAIENKNCYEYLGLTEVVIPDMIEYRGIMYTVVGISDYAFSCKKLQSVTIGRNIEYIKSTAFRSCSNLTSIVWNSVRFVDTRIQDAPFFDYKHTNQLPISSFVFGNDIKRVPNYICMGMRLVSSIIIPDSARSIGTSAFYGCRGLTAIEIPDKVANVELSAFEVCTGLTTIAIPDNVTSIGEYTFAHCTSLTSVTIGNGVTSIGDFAFDKCTSLTSMTIGNSVVSIGNWAFSECASLASIEIPNSVTSIGYGTFSGCIALTSINVSPHNLNYCSIEGVLFNKNKTTLVEYPCGKQGEYSFPNGVTSIGIYAFYGCTGLTSVTIPNSVTNIEKNAFSGCTGLTSITCEAVIPPSCGMNVFQYVDKSIPLYVPARSVSAYKTANQWKDFNSILAIPGTEGIDIIERSKNQTQTKFLRNGHIVIQNGNKEFSILGNEL